MTGTLVTADKPVAVFSGHRCTNVPSATGYCDYLVEQLTDVTRWGKTHHTSPFSGRTRYTVRIIASQNSTTFTTVPSGMAGTLNAGQFADVELTGAGEFVSNNPVLVAQFMRGYADDAAGKGDPSMVLVTPVEQAVTDATFGVDGLAGTPGAFINVVTETASLASLKLDNIAVNSTLFTPIGGTSIYSTGTIPVSPGAHILQGSVPYSALVYDYGVSFNAVSYAYPVAIQFLGSASPIPTPTPTPTPAPSVCSSEQETEHYPHTNNAHDHSITHHGAGEDSSSTPRDHSSHSDHATTDQKTDDNDLDCPDSHVND
jgi:hypothetical protein